MTDLIDSLNQAAERASSISERVRALADLGSELAQLGRILEARQSYERLRSMAAGNSGQIAIESMILEGVLLFYESLALESIDRLRRANALAKALSLNSQIARSSVWLAHLSFNFEEYSMMKSAFDSAFLHFDKLDDGLKARACLVIADASNYLGKDQIFQEWYDFARRFGLNRRDRAVLSAIEYNRLVMSQSRVRLRRVLNLDEDVNYKRNWKVELQSVRALHAAFKAEALQELILVSDAQFQEGEQNYDAAAVILQELVDAGATERCGISSQLMRIEIDWCLSQCDRLMIEKEKINEIVSTIKTLSMNERLVACSFLDDILVKRGDHDITAVIEELRGPALVHLNKTLFGMDAALLNVSDYRSIARQALAS